MLFSIILFSSLAFSFIFKGYYENIFIVLATIAFYKQVIVNKNYKSLIYGVVVSFISVNLIISFIFKDYILIKDVEPINEKEETLVLLDTWLLPLILLSSLLIIFAILNIVLALLNKGLTW